MHESLIADELRARYLELAMRDAWLRLKRSPALLRQVIDSLLTDDAYMELFYRFNGLFNLADELDFAGVRQEA